MKKIVAIMLVFVFAFSIAVCAEESDKTLRVVLPSEPPSLLVSDPQISTKTIEVAGAFYDTLVKLDPETKELKPNLAKNWEWVDDTRIRFELVEDAVAADGTPLTAEDVYYTLEVAKERSPAYMGRYLNIDKTEVVNDYEIIVGLADPLPGLLNYLADPQFGIYSKSAVEAVGGLDKAGTNPAITSGKYLFKEWKSGQYILFERNENYWNEDYEGYYKYIKYSFVGDGSSRILQVQSGDADVATDIPINQAAPMMESPAVDVHVLDTGSVMQLYFNTQREPLDNVKVRKALSLLIDKKAINDLVNRGYGRIEEGGISATNPYFSEVGVETGPNVEKAEKLLAEAGYQDGFTINCPITANLSDIASIIQENLAKAGVKMNIEILEETAAGPRIRKGQYDVILGKMSNGVRTGGNWILYNSEMIGQVYGGSRYVNKELDKWIEKAKTAKDEEKVKDAYKNALEIIHDNSIVVGLFGEIVAVVSDKGLTGFSRYPRMGTNVTNVRPK